MTALDTLGHFAYLWILIGMVLLTGKHSIGWLIRLVGELLWVGIGILMGMSSIWFWGIVFMSIDLHGWLKWRRSEVPKP